MSRIEWPSLTRALAWTIAATFIGGTILVLLFAFEVLGSPPEPGEAFIDNVIADFEFQRSVWPFELLGTSLFAIGFLGLGALGPVLARLAAVDDARSGLISTSLLAAGGFGAASQLIVLGARPVISGAEFCECGLLAEEVMARLMTFRVMEGIQTWLISGAMLAAAVGLIAAAGLGRDAGMPTGWRWLSLATAGLALLGAILPLFSVYPIDVLLVALVAGILVPIWVLWLASRAGDLAQPTAAPTGDGLA